MQAAQSYYPESLTNAWNAIVTEENSAIFRTIVGVASVGVAPYSAVMGAILTGVKPEWAKVACEGLDYYVLNRLWNNMTPNQKAAATAAGVGLYLTGNSIALMVLGLPASVFAAKVGAEMVIRNLERVRPS